MQQLFLTNTLTGKKEQFVTQEPGHIKLYVCGITPYDYAHVGHGRCYITFDVLLRLVQELGYVVTYCRNFTDIDDKLINRAIKEFNNPARYHEIATRYIDAFQEDMQTLHCLLPTYQPRVTDTMPEIILFIKGLIDSGHAYVVDGDVYFSIDSFPVYGKLSKRQQDDVMAGARVAVTEKKKNPLDFALWKSEKVGTYWQSPWGYGRPGWHIECSAMAKKFLGNTIDIHGGGMDLIFPHHENEIAQSEALLGVPFVRYWMHNAFVRINQEKMSKSLGNFFTLREIFERFDPMVVRYMMVNHHYRSPLDFSFEDIEMVQKSYQKLCKIFDTVRASERLPQDKDPIIIKMLEFLCDDLNTPGMLGVVFEHIKQIQENPELCAQVKYIFTTILGLELVPLAEKLVEMTPQIKQLLQEREAARAAKNWAQADLLREKLKQLGYDVQDKKI